MTLIFPFNIYYERLDPPTQLQIGTHLITNEIFLALQSY